MCQTITKTVCPKPPSDKSKKLPPPMPEPLPEPMPEPTYRHKRSLDHHSSLDKGIVNSVLFCTKVNESSICTINRASFDMIITGQNRLRI